MFQIEIPKRAACCMKGGEPLLQGSNYYSALVKGIDGDESYQRRDFCSVCWEKIANSQDPQRIVSSWKSTVPLKKELSELPKRRDERAFYLLREALADQENSKAMEEAFVLALYLARRRLIFLRQEIKREGRSSVSIYEVAETEEMLCVPKIILSDLHVEKVQLELAGKFNAK